jgi:hypothetical protein
VPLPVPDSKFFSFNPISAEALARGRGAENAELRGKKKNQARKCPILTLKKSCFRTIFSLRPLRLCSFSALMKFF